MGYNFNYTVSDYLSYPEKYLIDTNIGSIRI